MRTKRARLLKARKGLARAPRTSQQLALLQVRLAVARRAVDHCITVFDGTTTLAPVTVTISESMVVLF